jgi:hypothetical protein
VNSACCCEVPFLYAAGALNPTDSLNLLTFGNRPLCKCRDSRYIVLAHIIWFEQRINSMLFDAAFVAPLLLRRRNDDGDENLYYELASRLC